MPTVIGPIIRLQVQRSPLKVGEKPNRRYVPDPITAVDRLRISRDGIIGIADGTEILDVHHRFHSAGKNDDGRHGVSVGFTAHYAAMQQRFGSHLAIGCAGENLIVESAERLSLAEVARGFVLLGPDGHEKGRLQDIEVAHPCRPFTGFAHRYETVEPAVLRDSLVFLDGGMRGFYGTFYGERQSVVIEAGDLLGTL